MRAACVIALCASSLVACGPRPLPEGPLGDLSRELFRDFDADTAALPGIVAAMDAELADLDLESRPRGRMFSLPPLTAAYHADVTVVPGIDETKQLGLGLAGVSSHDLDANLEAQVQEDQVCINADAAKCHLREGTTDVACFLDGSCEVYRTLNTIRIETLPIKIWITVPVDFRRVELDDGRTAVVARTWMEEAATSDREHTLWNQRFGVDVFVPDPDEAGRTRRWYGSWLGGDVDNVGGDWLERVLRGGMDEGFTNPDDWLDGKECKVDTSTCEWPE